MNRRAFIKSRPIARYLVFVISLSCGFLFLYTPPVVNAHQKHSHGKIESGSFLARTLGYDERVYARKESRRGWGKHDRHREWESLPPEKRRLLRKRLQEWKQLSPSDRALLRRRFEQWKRLSPEERMWIKQKLKHWNELSPEEKEMIRRKFLNE